MFDGIDATGWLVILSALALGFGMVRFMIVTARERESERKAEGDTEHKAEHLPDEPPR
jgi:hypothetical protein